MKLLAEQIATGIGVHHARRSWWLMNVASRFTKAHKGIAMQFSGIEYSVVQGIERRLWKWAAKVSGIEISGFGSTRDEAIEKAEKAIARTFDKQRIRRNSDGERR